MRNGEPSGGESQFEAGFPYSGVPAFTDDSERFRAFIRLSEAILAGSEPPNAKNVQKLSQLGVFDPRSISDIQTMIGEEDWSSQPDGPPPGVDGRPDYPCLFQLSPDPINPKRYSVTPYEPNPDAKLRIVIGLGLSIGNTIPGNVAGVTSAVKLFLPQYVSDPSRNALSQDDLAALQQDGVDICFHWPRVDYATAYKLRMEAMRPEGPLRLGEYDHYADKLIDTLLCKNGTLQHPEDIAPVLFLDHSQHVLASAMARNAMEDKLCAAGVTPDQRQAMYDRMMAVGVASTRNYAAPVPQASVPTFTFVGLSDVIRSRPPWFEHAVQENMQVLNAAETYTDPIPLLISPQAVAANRINHLGVLGVDDIASTHSGGKPNLLGHALQGYIEALIERGRVPLVSVWQDFARQAIESQNPKGFRDFFNDELSVNDPLWEWWSRTQIMNFEPWPAQDAAAANARYHSLLNDRYPSRTNEVGGYADNHVSRFDPRDDRHENRGGYGCAAP